MEQADRGQVSRVGSLHLLDEEEGPDWQRCAPRHVTDEQFERFAGYAKEMFEALGMDMNTPGTLNTPMRFVKALFDATEGYEGDSNLVTAFPTECRGGPHCKPSPVIQ